MTDEATPKRALSASTVELGPVTHPTAPARKPFDLEAGRFEARGELGRGGMGRVDDAFDRVLGRSVAIKHLLRATDTDLARFAREARLTACLEHPGIVPIHDVGYEPDGTPYYIMRRVDGRPLADLVHRTTLAQRLALIPNVLAACDAVAFAHARGIVHRDLKPQNILVGRFGETLVIDWGLAREIEHATTASGSAMPLASADDALTNAGAVAGTPGFMAPEQARGETVDARADVFALGATLFFVLADALLYASASATEMVALAGDGRPPNWSALPAGVPADLRAIVVKAVAIDPAARYADAGALAADLRRFVTGNLVAAHEYGRLARIARFVRRHRGAVTVATAAVITVALVGVISVRRIIVERDAASAARALAETRQREAADAADHMLIVHAQELAATDPVAAVTLLRQLEPSSTRWREAWLVAVAAWIRGVPFGFHVEHKLMWVQIAADSRRAVTTSTDGTISIYDLATRTRQVVAHLPGAAVCQWVGEHAVLCRATSGLALVDTSHATTRSLDIDAAEIISDRRSRAVAETRDHRIVMIDGATGTAHELATGGVLGGASLDLDEVAIWHGVDLAVWTAAGVLPVARAPGTKLEAAGVDIRDHALVAMLGDDIVRWHVDGDRVVEDHRWPRKHAIAAGFVGSHVYGFGYDELSIDGAAVHSLKPAAPFSIANGLGIIETDGRIAMLGDGTSLHLGPYPAHIQRADVSPDGRFLVATSTDDDVLAWDLDKLRPRSVFVETREAPTMLAPPYVWMLDFSRGIVRHELDTDKTAISIDAFVTPDSWIGVSTDASWIAVRSAATSQIDFYDVKRDRTGRIRGAAAQAVDLGGILFARADGALREWRSDTNQPSDVGRIPAAPLGLTINGTVVVALYADRRVSRLDLATNTHTEVTLDADVRNIVVGARGEAWIAKLNGSLWRWPVGAAPVRVELADPVDMIAVNQGHVLARTPRSLVEVDATPMRALPIEARAIAPLTAGYIAALSSHGEVSLVDLESGARIMLPTTAVSDSLVTRGDTLMFAPQLRADDKYRYDAIALAVPHDPAALRRWLLDVTNATDGGWPSP